MPTQVPNWWQTIAGLLNQTKPDAPDLEAQHSVDRQMILGQLKGLIPGSGFLEDMPSPPSNGLPDYFGPQDLTPRQQREPGYMLSRISQNQPQRQQLAAATPTPGDPMQGAVQEALRRYPWLQKINKTAPLKLIKGSGPYMSESYMPNADENPHKGHFTVELRSPRLVNDPSSWPASLGREGMDYMARADPVFQTYAKAFRQTMTKPQLARAQERYQKELKTGERRSFEDFLKGAENQEYIGGYVFDMPGWRDAGWTPEQRNLLDGLKNYMWQGQPPTPVNIPSPK